MSFPVTLFYIGVLLASIHLKHAHLHFKSERIEALPYNVERKWRRVFSFEFDK